MRGRSSKSVSSGGAISSLAESLVGVGGRPRSPHMNNEEPIELAHWPDAHRPKPSDTPKIERDDFPAPPYPYTDPERRRRWSDSYQVSFSSEMQTVKIITFIITGQVIINVKIDYVEANIGLKLILRNDEVIQLIILRNDKVHSLIVRIATASFS